MDSVHAGLGCWKLQKNNEIGFLRLHHLFLPYRPSATWTLLILQGTQQAGLLTCPLFGFTPSRS